jgi:hypothetical protein
MIKNKLDYFYLFLFCLLVSLTSAKSVLAIDAPNPIPIYPGATTDNTPDGQKTVDSCFGLEKGPSWHESSELPLAGGDSKCNTYDGWKYQWHWDQVSSDSFSQIRDWYLNALKNDGWDIDDLQDVTGDPTDCHGNPTGKIDHTTKISFSKSDLSGKQYAIGSMDIDDLQRNMVGMGANAMGCNIEYKDVVTMDPGVTTSDPYFRSSSKQSLNIEISNHSITTKFSDVLNWLTNLFNILFNWLRNIFSIFYIGSSINNTSSDHNFCPSGFTAVAGGTQYTYQNLKVGVSNIAVETYADENGKTQRGLTAGFWFSVNNDSASNQQISAHTGQIVNFGTWKISVDKIRSEDKGYVCLKVEPLPMK